jgi:hypothetical protein
MAGGRSDHPAYAPGKLSSAETLGRGLLSCNRVRGLMRLWPIILLLIVLSGCAQQALVTSPSARTDRSPTVYLKTKF